MLTTIMKPGHYHYEAWLDDTISDSDLVIPGYHVVRRDRDRHGGGVALFITDCIPFSIALRHASAELLVVELRLRSNRSPVLCGIRTPQHRISPRATISSTRIVVHTPG